MARPPGLPKTGGRRKGVPNKATAQREAKIAESGLTPLDYMLGLMRDAELATDVRLEAAKSAAPYVHPKLSQVDATIDGHMSHEAWLLNLPAPDEV